MILLGLVFPMVLDSPSLLQQLWRLYIAFFRKDIYTTDQVQHFKRTVEAPHCGVSGELTILGPSLFQVAGVKVSFSIRLKKHAKSKTMTKAEAMAKTTASTVNCEY